MIRLLRNILLLLALTGLSAVAFVRAVPSDSTGYLAAIIDKHRILDRAQSPKMMLDVYPEGKSYVRTLDEWILLGRGYPLFVQFKLEQLVRSLTSLLTSRPPARYRSLRYCMALVHDRGERSQRLTGQSAYERGCWIGSVTGRRSWSG